MTEITKEQIEAILESVPEMHVYAGTKKGLFNKLIRQLIEEGFKAGQEAERKKEKVLKNMGLTDYQVEFLRTKTPLKIFTGRAVKGDMEWIEDLQDHVFELKAELASERKKAVEVASDIGEKILIISVATYTKDGIIRMLEGWQKKLRRGEAEKGED